MFSKTMILTVIIVQKYLRAYLLFKIKRKPTVGIFSKTMIFIVIVYIIINEVLHLFAKTTTAKIIKKRREILNFILIYSDNFCQVFTFS